MRDSEEVQKYLSLRRHYRQQAEEEFVRGDTIQAGEKAWGSAASQVKAIAEQRGWRHDSHPLLGIIAAQLADEWGRPGWHDNFRLVEGLHVNFYEDILDNPHLRAGLDRAQRLVEEMELAQTDGPPPGFMPNALQQLRLDLFNGRISLNQYNSRRRNLPAT